MLGRAATDKLVDGETDVPKPGFRSCPRTRSGERVAGQKDSNWNERNLVMSLILEEKTKALGDSARLPILLPTGGQPGKTNLSTWLSQGRLSDCGGRETGPARTSSPGDSVEGQWTHFRSRFARYRSACSLR